jgi:hypothetical protein
VILGARQLDRRRIIRSIAGRSFTCVHADRAAGQIQRFANFPLAVGLAEPKLKLERLDIVPGEPRLHKMSGAI